MDDLRVSYQTAEDGRVQANEALLEARSQLEELNEKLYAANNRAFAAEDRASKLETMLKAAEQKLDNMSSSLKNALMNRRDLNRLFRRLRKGEPSETGGEGADNLDMSEFGFGVDRIETMLQDLITTVTSIEKERVISFLD